MFCCRLFKYVSMLHAGNRSSAILKSLEILPGRHISCVVAPFACRFAGTKVTSTRVRAQRLTRAVGEGRLAILKDGLAVACGRLCKKWWEQGQVFSFGSTIDNEKE